MAKKVVIASACRTAIGKMGGALSNTPAADLGAIVIKEALNRAGVAPEMVDAVSYTHLDVYKRQAQLALREMKGIRSRRM